MSLRYSIYKVQTSRFALAHSFLILSRSASFVKNFFQVFSNFSEVFIACCSREQLRYVSTSAFICQALFSRFFKFRTDSLFICAARKQLAYISTPFFNCQALFSIFTVDFFCLLVRDFCPFLSHTSSFFAGFLSLRESESDTEPPNF